MSLPFFLYQYSQQLLFLFLPHGPSLNWDHYGLDYCLFDKLLFFLKSTLHKLPGRHPPLASIVVGEFSFTLQCWGSEPRASHVPGRLSTMGLSWIPHPRHSTLVWRKHDSWREGKQCGLCGAVFIKHQLLAHISLSNSHNNPVDIIICILQVKNRGTEASW